MKRFALFLALTAWFAAAVAGEVHVKDVRTWDGPSHTRIVFDLSGPVQHRLFTLKNPDRVVVDIDDTAMKHSLVRSLGGDGVLQDVRSAPRNGNDLRVVFDLRRAVHPKSFVVPPNDTYGNRLVVDLEKPRSGSEPVKTVSGSSSRDLVIAIDAGHGGEDPGAIGAHGTHEKDVTIAVARKLADLVDKQPGMRAVLTRKGDYYVGLRERTRIAKKAHADMFISLHADAFRDHSVRGSSVFVLSRRGASSEMAHVLAKHENASDRIGGVSLDDKDDMVASVLVDLSRAATIESSSGLAKDLLDQLDDVGEIHHSKVERAAFVVLKSLDMPSVLVELAFISNPTEERNLRSSSYQWHLARALRDGVVHYAGENMPSLRMASASGDQTYVVKPGDTLSDIASRYSVSVNRLRAANDLNGDTIMAGSHLTIP